MSDPIMQALDEMLDIARSSSVPLGVPIAIHTDRLLRDNQRALRTAVNALRAVHEKLGIDDYCESCTHVDCETSRTIATALGVDDE